MRKLTITFENQSSYDILIEKGLLEKLPAHLANVYDKKNLYIITDSIVASYYLERVTKILESAGYVVKSVIFKAGEDSKNIETYINLSQELIDLGIRRNEMLIALGGGVVGDMTGFIASTLYRGIPYINIPTTLLSQMDSSIGGKTGIDFHDRKNILGAFKQPSLVMIDQSTLDTLTTEEVQSGMGELIKHAMIGNKSLLDLLVKCPSIDENIIADSLDVKRKVVEIDPFDQGERMKLNFGHTFGHAIELKYHIKHGIAVCCGMVMATEMAIDLGLSSVEVLNILKDILQKYRIPMGNFDYHDYLTEVKFDKKNLAGVINFIFVKNLGEAIICPMTEDDIKELM